MSQARANVRDRTRLEPQQVTWSCPAGALTFESTDKVAPVEGTIGQDRALRALRLGLELYSPGYNIYVSGFVGTGRTSTVNELLAEISPRCQVPRDRAYVRNFSDPDRPRLLTSRAGGAVEFQKDMRAFVQFLKERLPAVFEDKAVAQRRERIANRYSEKEQEQIREFQELLKSQGFALVSVQVGPVQRPEVFPTHEGRPLPPSDYEELVGQGKVTREEAERVMARLPELQAELHERMRQGRNLAREMTREIDRLHQEVGMAVIGGQIEDLLERYGEDRGVKEFLDEVRGDVLENLELLGTRAEGEEAAAAEQHYALYAVNVISDHSKTKGCPVVTATNPTYTSLFGTIERVPEGPGVWRTDHTMIKGGHMLEADGGYLLINALDILQQPGVWPALMRALKCCRLEIGVPENMLFGFTSGLKPEPIDLNLKVVLIGEPIYYDLLFRHDPDFRKIFKVKADFAPDMDLRSENLDHFAKVVARICEKEGLLPLSRSAIGRLAEESVRMAGRRDRISARFAQVADVVREADYWCKEEAEKIIRRRHVQRAIEEREFRLAGLDGRIQDLMEKDILIIRTEGAMVGQVNGLSVYDLGYHAFGKPTLITASTAVGQAGIISIEREARLSGGIYDKGVLIISGYLRRMFARKRPLALTASLCFEQSYSGVDGDSASITEIFALLSDLSGLPIDQGIAVTGSINQHGEIQPIGGVNEKVEGFFHLCHARGLTGTQGVIIPKRNVEDLMLGNDVLTAIRKGTFSIYAISSVEEGIEILTGVAAGARVEDGEYPEGTVFRLVEERLTQYLDALRGPTKEREDWKILNPPPPPCAPKAPRVPPGLPPKPPDAEDLESEE